MLNDRPNIVLVMTDQQRADFVAGEGFPLDTMPFADSLADQGVRFRQAYTSSPLCVPARCSLMTGRFPKVTQVRQNSTASLVQRGPDIVDVLRDAGYRLNFAGKTHFYREPADFDAFAGPYGHLGGPASPESQAADFDRWLHAFGNEVAGEPTPFPAEAQLASRIVSDAIAQVDASPRGTPFFSWLSFPEPHNPYQVPEPYFSLFAEDSVPERVAGPDAARGKAMPWPWLQRLIEEKRPDYDRGWRRYRANYCGMLRLVDDQVRRYMLHLRHLGRADDTIFVMLSDHGDYVGDYGLQRKGAGMPECLVRIPLAIAGPGIRGGVQATELVSIVDILPTLCDALGVEIPLGVQGRSLWPLLTARPYPAEEFSSVYAECGYGGLRYEVGERPALHFPYEGRRFDELNTVTQSGRTKMLRKGSWKLIYDSAGHGELYDLDDDPAELTDRWADPSAAPARAAMVEELLRWTIVTDDDLPRGVYTPKRADHNWYRSAGAAAHRGDEERLSRGA